MRMIVFKALLLVLVINAVGLVLAYLGASTGAADVTFGAAAPILKRSFLLSLIAGASWIGIAAGVRGSAPSEKEEAVRRRRARSAASNGNAADD
jgi:hypothetical protein